MAGRLPDPQCRSIRDVRGLPPHMLPRISLWSDVVAASDDFDFGVYNNPGTSSSFSSGMSLGADGSPESPFIRDPGEDGSSLFEAAGPPVLWMWAGIVAALIGLALAVIAGNVVPLSWTAWALAGPVAIGLYSVFSLRDTKQRSKPLYGDRVAVTWTLRIGWILAFLGVIIAALRLADWAGRL